MQALSIMIKPVSGACNMRCRYCFYTDVMAHRETSVYPKMDLDTLETLVRRAFRAADGPVQFAFQGGEPTLAGVDFYRALMRFERSYNTRNLPVTNVIQTNGYSLSDEMIALFAREHFLVGISLDGDRFTHDQMRPDAHGVPSYDIVSKNIARLKRANVEFNILCVVNKYVAERAKDVFNALAPYTYLQFISCLDGLDGKKTPYSLTNAAHLHFLKVTFDLYYQAYMSGKPVSIRNFDNYIGILLGRHPESCAMGGQCGQYYIVESDGGVYPCDFYVLDQWRLGNIREMPFNRLALSPLRRAFYEESLCIPEKCRNCKWYYLCRNGCKRERNPITGINVWCECFCDFFEYAVPRMEILADKIRAESMQCPHQ